MSDSSDQHEANRSKVCGLCFRKPKNHQRITPMILNLIQKIVFDQYSLEDSYLPLIVCKSCVASLKVMDSDKANRALPDVDYAGLAKPKTLNTRSSSGEKCCCSGCVIARMNGLE